MSTVLRPFAASALVALASACSGGFAAPAGHVASPTTAAAPGGPVASAPPPVWSAPSAPLPAVSTAVAPVWGGPADSIALPAPTPTPRPDERPGLGTSWGESTYAPITMVPFSRASHDPWAVVALRYNDADGVAAQAAYHGGSLGPLEAAAGDGSLGISLVGDDGRVLPGVWAGGQALVAGVDGARYRIVVRNASRARFEVVASVDGLDVIDGQPASPERRGYLVDPGDELVIDGFRQSDDEVAAFRFGKVASSYAARTAGDSNVGVIGLAIFAERGAVWTPAELGRRAAADPFPARSYASAPR